jgi:hypothetical protein
LIEIVFVPLGVGVAVGVGVGVFEGFATASPDPSASTKLATRSARLRKVATQGYRASWLPILVRLSIHR